MTPWTPAYQASLSIISQIFLKFMSIESVMSPNHLILCLPLLLLLSVFSNESTLLIRWPKYWSFSSSIGLSNEYSGLISFRTDLLISLLSKGLSRVFTSTTIQKHLFFGAQPFLWSNSHIRTWLLEKIILLTPVFLPGESHGQRNLAGYSPWGCKELDTTEQLSMTIWTFVSKVMSLLFNTLSRFVIAFIPRNRHLLIQHLFFSMM